MRGVGRSTIVGERKSFPCQIAAFANGSIAHGIELDDTHSGTSAHPGSVVFPAALAVSERMDLGGEDFIPAAVAGYELMIRIGEAAGPSNISVGVFILRQFVEFSDLRSLVLVFYRYRLKRHLTQ